MSYVSKYDIVRLWHKTQMGPMKRCQEAQGEFADMMWKLYEQRKEKDDDL